MPPSLPEQLPQLREVLLEPKFTAGASNPGMGSEKAS